MDMIGFLLPSSSPAVVMDIYLVEPSKISGEMGVTSPRTTENSPVLNSSVLVSFQRLVPPVSAVQMANVTSCSPSNAAPEVL